MLQSLTWNQIREWLVFDDLEPIGRDWERTGTAALMNRLTQGGSEFDVDCFRPKPPAEDDE